MKIAIDCRLYHQGGVGRYIRNLIYQLEKIDTKNQYTLFFYQILPKKISSRFYTKLTNAKWHSLLEQTVFAKELKAGNFDLVHFPYFSHPISYNRPFVITIHDLTVKHFSTGRATTQLLPYYYLKRLGYQLVLKHGISYAKQILVPSKAVEEDLITEFAFTKPKITVTYEGLDEEFFKTKPKAVSLPNPSFWLYVGNFYPHKNVTLLLQALASLNDKNQHLVLVGPKDIFLKRLKKQINELGLQNQVTLLSGLNDNELAWLYQKTLGLILPSLFEGFGLPILEAAYFSCPLLLSKIAVFKEIAPPRAKFFDPHSFESLKSCLLNPPLRSNSKPLKSYWLRFSFAKLAAKTLAVYQKNK